MVHFQVTINGLFLGIKYKLEYMYYYASVFAVIISKVIFHVRKFKYFFKAVKGTKTSIVNW